MADEVLKTIIKQMKAQDRDYRLYGAKLMRMKDNKLRVHVKRGTKVRNIDVELNAMDTYDVEDHTFSTSMKSKNPFKVTTKKHKGLFFDQFGDLLEGKI
jgi:hypothetical protein